jgi:RNA polymerase sigma-70 factor, ECF subfamily
VAAQFGDRDAIGEVFQQLRAYLLSCAQTRLDRELQVKVSPSDVVQETLLEAHRGFAGFRGGSRAELVVWIQGILNHRVQTAHRMYRGTQRRNISLEKRMEPLDASNPAPTPEPAITCSSPSGHAIANEESQRLAAAIRELSPRYEQVIRLRNELKLSFDEVALALCCSPDAAQKLWTRAVRQLSQKLTSHAANQG